MLGDVAVAVNPDDERYQSLIGKSVKLPLTGRTIPIVADAHVDREFGTGAVKITPAHDFDDWEVAQRHNLSPLSIFNLDATVNANAPEKYRGLDRFVARKAVLEDLEKEGLLVSEKAHTLAVPRCERTGQIIEPMLTDQWFVATRKPAPATHPYFPGKSIQELCLAVVSEAGLPEGAPGAGEKVRFVPGEWLTWYLHWINNIKEWTISRQLWWGTRFRRGTTRRATSTWLAARPTRDAGPRQARPRTANVRARPGRPRHVVQLGPVVPFDTRLA
jgi:valyl-tRNA synthetase